MVLPNFELSVAISSENRTNMDEIWTANKSESMTVHILQPRNGELHESVKIECTPLGDGWYVSRVFVNGREEVVYESSEKHEITHTRTGEGFRRGC